MAPINGSAVTIYSGKEANMDKLRRVLDQDDIRDLPIVIIPVAGEYRTGKSFLLSIFIRYLTNLAHGDRNDNLFGDENEELIGFDHKCSTKSVTQGIRIWDKPLIVNESGKKIVVLMMDSQGIFAGNKDRKVSTRIFALTTMISSVMVFNLSSQINDVVLGQLKLFTAYANEATDADTDGSPFQKLMILIRDWGKCGIFPYGFDGGHAYLDDYTQGNNSDADNDEDDNDNDGDESSLDSYFREIECYLMPNPGKCVQDKTYNGCFKELDEEFKKHIKNLTVCLLNPQELAHNLKEVTGIPITASIFCDYFEKCTKLMDNKDWDQSGDMLKMNTTFNCELAKREAVTEYKAQMDNETSSFIINETGAFMSEVELINLNTWASKKAQQIYGDKGVFARKNDKELYAEYETKMNQDLEGEYPNYEEKLKTARDLKKGEETVKQVAAIEESMNEYKIHMKNETESHPSDPFMSKKTPGTFMEDQELKTIHGDATTKAIKKYEGQCKAISLFTEIFNANKQKLTKDMEGEYPNYEEKLKTARDLKKAQENGKQVEAIEASKNEYKIHMKNETESHSSDPFISKKTPGTFMEEQELKTIHGDATTKAIQKYEGQCKAASIFPEIFRANKQKLTKELEEEYPKYEEKLKNVKEIKRKQEELNQADAIGEAKKTYKADMDRDTTLFMTTASKTFLEDGELKGIDNNAQAKAIKNYEDKCKAADIMFLDKYRENKKKLTKELEEESKHYACVQEVQRMRVKDKEDAEIKIEETKTEFDNKLQEERNAAETKIQAAKTEFGNNLKNATDLMDKKIQLVEFFATTEGDNLGYMIWSGGGTTVSFGMTLTEELTKGVLGMVGRNATLNTLKRIDKIVIYNVNPATRKDLEKEYKDYGDSMNMNLIKKVLQANNKTLQKTERDYEIVFALVNYHLWLD